MWIRMLFVTFYLIYSLQKVEQLSLSRFSRGRKDVMTRFFAIYCTRIFTAFAPLLSIFAFPFKLYSLPEKVILCTSYHNLVKDGQSEARSKRDEIRTSKVTLKFVDYKWKHMINLILPFPVDVQNMKNYLHNNMLLNTDVFWLLAREIG